MHLDGLRNSLNLKVASTAFDFANLVLKRHHMIGKEYLLLL